MIMLRGCYILTQPALTAGADVLHGVLVSAGEMKQRHRRYLLYSKDRAEIQEWANLLQEVIAYSGPQTVGGRVRPNVGTRQAISLASDSSPRCIVGSINAITNAARSKS